MNIRIKDAALLLLVGFLLLVFGVAIFGNLKGFLAGMSDLFAEVWDGVVLLFFTGLALGAAYCVVKIRQASKIQVIGPDKHGHKQALVLADGRIEHLNAPSVDPRVALELMLQTQKLAQAANATTINEQKLMALLAKQQEQAKRQIEPPKEQQLDERIADIVHYEEIADSIPSDMSLLGIHPEDGSLELTDWEKLKCLWVVGSSSSGKSNTVFGKAQEAQERGAKFAVVDQHATKPDSLARRIKVFESSFLRPIAISDQEVLATLEWFKAEFERRVACKACAVSSDGTPCAQHQQKIVLICDEMNRMNRNEVLRKPLQEIVAICGEESRGFGMYGWFISQKCTHLKWLRDSAITVIVHCLTRFEEALLACNDDRKAAKRLLQFKVGRTFVYGVDFDELMELQQALYPMPKNDSPITYPNGEEGTSTEELPEQSADDSKLVYFLTAEKPLEVEDANNFFCAQESSEKRERIARVAQMMIEEKSVNQILAAEWGISSPGGAYQAALPELREIQKAIARKAFGTASEAGMN